MAQATLCATVEAPEPPLALMKPMVRPIGRRAFGGKEFGDGVDDRLRAGRQHEIFGDAGADQFAVEQHVVDVAEHDQPRRGVADLGQPLEGVRDFLGRQRRLDDDQVRRRVGLVALDRALEPAIVRGQRDLGHAPVVHGGLDQLGSLRMLAEGLDGDARQQPGAGRDFAAGSSEAAGLLSLFGVRKLMV